MSDSSQSISNPSDFIGDSQKLTSIFHRWPTLHDAEVLSIRLDRDQATLFLELFVFETTRETDEQGYYKRLNECAVTFQFVGVEDLLIQGFNEQNVIAGLTLEKAVTIGVTLESIYGVSCSFSCKTARVESVVPKRRSDWTG